MFKFYLDTDALIRLSRLDEKRLEDFKTRFNSKDAELIVTHVQIDERFSTKNTQNYRELVERALTTLKNKKIRIRVENTKVGVIGISRIGFSSLSTPEIEKVYHELEKEIDACEKAKGNQKEQMNVKRDAIIAVSSLEHSFLITTDKCLCDSFNKVIEEKKELVKKTITPRARLAPQSSEAIADCIFDVFSNK